MRTLPLFLAFLAFSSSSAQDPRQQEHWRYFPMQIGDTWEYAITFNFESTPRDAERLEIIGDTTIDSHHYMIQRVTNLNLNTSDRFIRFDSTSNTIEQYGRYTIYPTQSGGCGFDMESCLSRTEDGWASMLPGFSRPFRFFYEGSCVGPNEYSYGLDFGLYHQVIDGRCGPGGSGTHRVYDLVYAYVDGVEYGERILPTSTGSQDELPTLAPLAIRPFPNPFTDELTLRLDLLSPSKVELKAFNVLGQEVWHRPARPYNAGANLIALRETWGQTGLFVIHATIHDGTTLEQRTASVRVVRSR